MKHIIYTPLEKDMISQLKTGDEVTINGTVYTARDAAHKRLVAMVQEGKQLPFDIEGQIIYYVGPCPAKPGKVIGSAGPTTSGRMDAYAPLLISMGLAGMIGKGQRNKDVVDAIIKYKSIYFGAIGGAGALISEKIVSQEIVAFPELGPEAIRKLEVRDFPAVVVIDSYGNNLYEIGREKYRMP
ncbi:MAG TPA: Fe-S-containing hydro-lyase [Clostridiales bacterium]|nr:Fe-S-containing hydro-lyase [Clostridiales bacterium]